MEKKLKAMMPYIIVVGLVYLIVPALLLTGSAALSYIVLIGLLPLTALLSCAHYSMNRNNEFLASLIAPVFFFVSMFLYGIVTSDALRAFIYLIAYFLCGYLGLTIGDILANRKNGGRSDRSAGRPAERRAAVPAVRRTTPSRVPVRDDEDEEEAPVRRAPVSRPAARPVREPVREPVRQAARQPEPYAADPYDDRSLDTSTTEDDIDAILREIHSRRSGD